MGYINRFYYSARVSFSNRTILFHLRDDHQSKSETKKNQVHAVHPAEEDKVGRHR